MFHLCCSLFKRLTYSNSRETRRGQLKQIFMPNALTGASPWVGLGWTCPLPLLPEGVPEIHTDPLSLDGRCGVG